MCVSHWIAVRSGNRKLGAPESRNYITSWLKVNSDLFIYLLFIRQFNSFEPQNDKRTEERRLKIKGVTLFRVVILTFKWTTCDQL